jgi:Uncharacterized protein SCO1/SenC/PrrC, involved in biogenesis of respiratory and photosynthetic systems
MRRPLRKPPRRSASSTRSSRGSTPTTYTVDHSAGSYVYDPQGRLRLYIKHGEKPEVIAKDLKLLVAGK